QPSLVSCLSSLGESLLYVTVAYGQSLGVLPSLSVASESGSHVTAVVSRSVYSATVAVPGVSKVGTLVHILARGGSEAYDILSGLTLPIEPKPLEQHRPPPPRSILSPGEVDKHILLRGGYSDSRIPSLRSTGGGGGYENGGSGGDDNAAGAVHLARRSPTDGGDSE
nr:hypothetical protein [Tanacetum cinerariifolium]